MLQFFQKNLDIQRTIMVIKHLINLQTTDDLIVGCCVVAFLSFILLLIILIWTISSFTKESGSLYKPLSISCIISIGCFNCSSSYSSSPVPLLRPPPKLVLCLLQNKLKLQNQHSSDFILMQEIYKNHMMMC